MRSERSRSNPYSMGSVLGLLLFGVVVGQGCGKSSELQAPPPEVTVVDVQQRDVPIHHEWVGQTYGAVDVEIRARVPGYLIGMHFTEGTEVPRGKLLYTIDATELEDKVASARAQLASAEVMYKRAQADARRFEPLAAINAVSQRDLDATLAEEGAAREQVEAAKAALRIAQTNLGYSRITAPIAGLIGFSQARVGNFVGQFPNPVILNTISQLDPIHVRFSPSESNYLQFSKRVQEGVAEAQARAQAQRLPLELILADGSVHPYPGYASTAERQIDPTTGSLQIEATFPNPSKLVRPGQYAKVRAVVENRKGALLVPQRAVIELQGKYFLYVVDPEGKVENRPVEPGPRVGEAWLIDQGLHPGERVVLEGVQRVRPGMTVKPVTAQEAAAKAAPAQAVPPAEH